MSCTTAGVLSVLSPSGAGLHVANRVHQRYICQSLVRDGAVFVVLVEEHDEQDGVRSLDPLGQKQPPAGKKRTTVSGRTRSLTLLEIKIARASPEMDNVFHENLRLYKHEVQHRGRLRPGVAHRSLTRNFESAEERLTCLRLPRPWALVHR